MSTDESLKPSLRFCYSEELHAKTLKLLDTLEQAADPTKHRGTLGDLVMELTNAGMDYYFLRPLRWLKPALWCNSRQTWAWQAPSR
jgi:hypothetical protein